LPLQPQAVKYLTKEAAGPNPPAPAVVNRI
jgi:hypothetical protein